MDPGPIYCAEQIVVPVELPDILKQFTKAVLKQQPADLLQFSAAYFVDLLNASKGISTITPPSAAQLHKAYGHLASTPEVQLPHLQVACEAAGIGASTLTQVLQAAGKPPGAIPVPEVLLLLLTLSCTTFDAVVSGMFDVFGPEVAAPVFQQLLGFLATKDPRNVDHAVLEQATEALRDREALKYDDLPAIPALWAKLGH